MRRNGTARRKVVSLLMRCFCAGLLVLPVLLSTLGYAQKKASDDEALRQLEAGNERFVTLQLKKKNFRSERRDLVTGQQPYAIVLGCSDSRVPPELVFDESLGKLFVVRVAGNVVDPVVLGSIEYAAEHLHTATLLVLGHEACGAVKATLGGGHLPPNIQRLVERIQPAVRRARAEALDEERTLTAAIRENVQLQMQSAVDQSEVLRELVEKGALRIAGGVYSLHSGKVQMLAGEVSLAHSGSGRNTHDAGALAEERHHGSSVVEAPSRERAPAGAHSAASPDDASSADTDTEDSSLLFILSGIALFVGVTILFLKRRTAMKWFYDLKISVKLLSGFVFVALIAGIIGYVGFNGMTRLAEDEEHLYTRITIPLEELGDIAKAFQRVRVNMRDLIMADSHEERVKYADTIKELAKHIDEVSEAYEKTIVSDEMRKAFDDFTDAEREFLGPRDRLIELALADRDEEATELLRGDVFKTAKAVEASIDKLEDLKIEHGEVSMKQDHDDAGKVKTAMMIALGIGIVTALGFGVWLSAIISKPVKQVAERAKELCDTAITNLGNAIERMSKGDLNLTVHTAIQPLEIDTRDEIGALASSMNGMIKQTQATVASFEQAAAVVRNLIESTRQLTVSALEGKLEVRSDATKFQGGFRDLVQGINDTLDAIVVPVNEASAVLQEVAERNLTARMQGDYKGDYLKIKTALNQAAEGMASAVAAIGQNAGALAGSSEELKAVSQQMSANAEETSSQSTVVSAAAEQVSKNVQTVATGTEEMGASIREIAKNASEAARVAAQAVKVAEGTNATVAKLGESSAEIGNVVKVITSIAEQTNLLALNATIEAARAGEAGKGFAVVANEVKELAKETAKATEDISKRIEAIQADTRNAVEAISEIGDIIKQINDISTTIASAVEEQSVTTNEITRNITEAAQGSGEIAQNISGIMQAAQSTTSGATDTQDAAGELSKMAAELQNLVGQFRYDGAEDRGAALTRRETLPVRVVEDVKLPARIKTKSRLLMPAS